ncbi:unnamed protein product, partial [Ectocarpus fasciculatus]
MSDKTFSRYLRARNYDLAKATEMLENTLRWREEFGLVDMKEKWMDQVASENASGKTYVRGRDKQGRPLLYMRPRHENTFEHDGNIKHLVYNLERSVACMTDSAEDDKICLLLDFDGYSMRNAPPMKTSRETLDILQNHYPERLHRAYCLRPPWIFSATFKMISPFIDPVTAQKIVMLRTTPELMTARLLEDIEAQLLETDLGGQDDRLFESSKYLAAEMN